MAVGATLEDSSATGVNGDQSDNSGTNSGAAYVFVRAGTNWSQQAYLKASNTGVSDLFAESLALAGNTLVIGAAAEDSNGNEGDNTVTNSGAAYVFVRTGTNWAQQAYLKAQNSETDDRYGEYVAVWNDTVVIGATQEDSNATGVNGNPGDNSATNSGAAYVLTGFGPTLRIQTQPVNQATNTGSNVTFTVSATSSNPPIHYQWKFSGTNLTGATSEMLVVTNVQVANRGEYQVEVTDSDSLIRSIPARLDVIDGLFISAQPADREVRVRPDPGIDVAPTTNTTFSMVVLSDNPPVTYQWRLNGTNLLDNLKFSGVNTPVLVVSNVTVDLYPAVFSCTVTDSVGGAMSTDASLFPLVRPTFLISPVSQTVPAGSSIPVSVVLSNGFPPPFGYQWRSNFIASATVVSNSKTNFYVIPPNYIPTNAVTSTYRVAVTNRATPTFQVPQSAVFTITTVIDTDRDGIPDATETALGLNSASASDAMLDLDGDGVSNIAEYQAGTDPTNSYSYLRVEINTPGNFANISVSAVSNRTYTIQYSDELPASWNNLSSLLALPVTRMESILDPAWTSNRFYRIVLPAQP